MADAPLIAARKPAPWNWSPYRVKRKWARALLLNYPWWFLSPLWDVEPVDGAVVRNLWGESPDGSFLISGGSPSVRAGTAGNYIHMGLSESSGERAIRMPGLVGLDATVGQTLLSCIERVSAATNDQWLITAPAWPSWTWRVTDVGRTMTLLPAGRASLVSTNTLPDHALSMLAATMRTGRHSVWVNGAMDENTAAGTWTFASNPDNRLNRFGIVISFQNEFDHGPYWNGVLNCEVPGHILRCLMEEPFALLEKGRAFVGFVAAGGIARTTSCSMHARVGARGASVVGRFVAAEARATASAMGQIEVGRLVSAEFLASVRCDASVQRDVAIAAAMASAVNAGAQAEVGRGISTEMRAAVSVGAVMEIGRLISCDMHTSASTQAEAEAGRLVAATMMARVMVDACLPEAGAVTIMAAMNARVSAGASPVAARSPAVAMHATVRAQGSVQIARLVSATMQGRVQTAVTPIVGRAIAAAMHAVVAAESSIARATTTAAQMQARAIAGASPVVGRFTAAEMNAAIQMALDIAFVAFPSARPLPAATWRVALAAALVQQALSPADFQKALDEAEVQ